MAKRQCKGKTRAGKRCKATPRRDTGYCNAHSSREVQESSGFGGAQPDAGRPRLPKPHELMRERIEENLERILKPYFDAIDSAMVTATYEGEVTASHIEDLGARIQAAEKLLDRVYGKPTVKIDRDPAADSPLVNLNLIMDDDLRSAAADLRRRLAAARAVEPGGADAGDGAALDASEAP